LVESSKGAIPDLDYVSPSFDELENRNAEQVEAAIENFVVSRQWPDLNPSTAFLLRVRIAYTGAYQNLRGVP
jgi:hypothetical protein